MIRQGEANSWGDSPVAVGGVGGSGTRLIAQILRHLGFYLGDDLNKASDNLWFTLLFKRTELWEVGQAGDSIDQAVQAFRAVMVGDTSLSPAQVDWIESLAVVDRPQHNSAWLGERVESLRRVAALQSQRHGRWGWKEPNTHIFWDRLQGAFPRMKYIHVMRNGLDMAHSSNQNQLRLWGSFFLNSTEYQMSPFWSLKFWCCVHRRILALGKNMPGQFLLLNYDDFCSSPEASLKPLLTFLEIDAGAVVEDSLLNLVLPPQSIGHFRQFGLAVFDPADVEFAKSLGFTTECH